jgi:hypothetical protein
MKNWKQILLVISLGTLTACASAGGGTGNSGNEHSNVTKAPPGGDYKQVSELAPLPKFIPGLGSLYVQPNTLPAGPFLAYDRDNQLVSTVYMIPMDELQKQTKFEKLGTAGLETVSVDMYYNAGHPGVAEPHYHMVLWHVPPAQAKLK